MSEDKVLAKDEAKGKLEKIRERRIWILSSFLCIIALGIALFLYYIPVFQHITLHTDDHIPIDFSPPVNATVDNHPYLKSLDEIIRDPIFKFFDILDITIIMTLALILLPAIAYYRDQRWRDNIDDHIPSLLREISDAQKTGLPLPRAILEASKHQYGALTPELKKMASKISWGIPFSKALRSLTEVADTPLMKRTSLLILEAERSGGAIEDVFESAHTHVSEILGLKRERLGSMKPYTWIIYASFIVFSIVMIILLYSFFQTLALQIVETVAEGQEERTAALPFNLAGLQLVFFHLMVIESIFSGLIAGKMGEGDAKIGLRHSCILLIICYISFKIYLIVFS
ncbi:MAG: type II secretion system F family protein [Candidatus Hodarchaeota archaeon]